MPAKIDLTGIRFTRLQVMGDDPCRINGRRRVSCLCDCGNIVSVDPRSLHAGHTKSCGCLQRERVSETTMQRCLTHGATKTKEYQSWVHMKARCNNPKDRKYPDYGLRGIKVCDRWVNDFAAFLSDLGPRPSAAHSLDRINPDGDYEPPNCRWATAKVQSRNKRVHRWVEYQGQTIPLSEACELSGTNYRSALYRLNAGSAWQPLPAPPKAAPGQG